MREQTEEIGSENDLIHIQDMIIIGSVDNLTWKYPTGEFGRPDLDFDTTGLDRLGGYLDELIDKVASTHSQNNCDDHQQLKADKTNHLTRLITSEFLFYTNKTLSLSDFQSLMESVHSQMRDKPANLHLILSSFAVKTPDGKVMNIVAHIESGERPKFNFIVKNHSSALDPHYAQLDDNSCLEVLPNIDIRNNDVINNLGILINSVHHPLSYNNSFVCETAAGTKFFSTVEICLDHCFGAGRHYLAQLANQNPEEPPIKQSSHVVVSSTTNIFPDQIPGNFITAHADPYYSCFPVNQNEGYFGLKPGIHGSVSQQENPIFGSSTITYLSEPSLLSQLIHMPKQVSGPEFIETAAEEPHPTRVYRGAIQELRASMDSDKPDDQVDLKNPPQNKSI